MATTEGEQSFFVGIRSTFYRVSTILGQGLLVMLAAAALSLGAMVCLGGCGSNGLLDQAPRSYNVVVTATDTITNARTSAKRNGR